jgi:hypothetical protein
MDHAYALAASEQILQERLAAAAAGGTAAAGAAAAAEQGSGLGGRRAGGPREGAWGGAAAPVEDVRLGRRLLLHVFDNPAKKGARGWAGQVSPTEGPKRERLQHVDK